MTTPEAFVAPDVVLKVPQAAPVGVNSTWSPAMGPAGAVTVAVTVDVAPEARLAGEAASAVAAPAEGVEEVASSTTLPACGADSPVPAVASVAVMVHTPGTKGAV